ncbi:hypothetical protein GUITHDRAFT_134511 [Guillardia theta CCMP2712]|uniref:Right handed beta helix domain-containing protein n=1 Tax=Guillardia theta (strain CCMP2712) TaxID=905079 RepID=L1JT52_GUITC|nr:hypothetical protein GUITHDRAFT_134511 [Guillardia theta CCMP2712]EKX51617.1 hypothetical protein GUITHDRAFT_134511 [Guillardia theta CCMP2712]|eukprot:XP_005838597.1 hypothetical protein GUITHDRAFT_134511 [Guillardia theta CCMP2712]
MANSALRSILCFLLCSLLAPRTLNEAVGMEKPLSFPRHEGDAAAKLLGRVMKASREQVRLVLEPGMHTLRESKGADNEPLTLSVVKHDMDYDVFKEHCKRSFPDNQTREEDMGPHDLFDILDSTPTANHPAFSASPPGSQMVQPDLAGSNDGSDEAGNPLRYLPGILSPSCCLPPTSRLLLRGNSSHDQKPQVEGSWKLLNSSRGVLEQVHFSNQHGSIFEVLSGPWEFRSCRLAAAGPWLVGPVCIFGRCEALINVSDCRFGRLETGRKRDVAHHGVAASGKTVCRVKNSCMEEFRMSDVSATDESSVSLSNSVLQYSNFAVSLASQARVKLESCELRDHNYSAFICPGPPQSPLFAFASPFSFLPLDLRGSRVQTSTPDAFWPSAPSFHPLSIPLATALSPRLEERLDPWQGLASPLPARRD